MISLKEITKMRSSKKILKEIGKKFIITESEREVLEFWKSVWCNVCHKTPSLKNKNYRISNEIFCKSCKELYFGK